MWIFLKVRNHGTAATSESQLNIQPLSGPDGFAEKPRDHMIVNNSPNPFDENR